MGDISDYYRNQNLDAEYRHHQIEEPDDIYVWTTSDGTKISIKNMSIQHITNTIRCITQDRVTFDNDEIKQIWLEAFNNELTSRDTFDSECDASELDLY